VATANYATSFTNQTSLTILGATHGLASKYLIPQVFNDATPSVVIVPDRLTIHATSFGVTVLFSAAQSGSLVLNGYGGSANAVNLGVSFTAQTSFTVSGSVHGISTNALCLAVYNTSAPAALIQPGRVVVDALSYGVTLQFAQAQDGYVVLNGFTA
jgi:hypothetical protein